MSSMARHTSQPRQINTTYKPSRISYNKSSYKKLLKLTLKMLTHIFATPRTTRRKKPNPSSPSQRTAPTTFHRLPASIQQNSSSALAKTTEMQRKLPPGTM